MKCLKELIIIYCFLAWFGILAITNRCKFEEFRCKDGNTCIKEEELCNIIQDCPDRDDEGLSCLASFVKHPLDTSCLDKTKTFKCRYGGKCIAPNLVCDGEIDCRGAGDEASDVCGTLIHNPVNNPTPMEYDYQDGRASFVPTMACERLHEEEGLQNKCFIGNRKVNCDVPAANETIAVYECKRHFSVARNVPRLSRRICRNGIWTKRNANWNCIPHCGKGGSQHAQFVIGGRASLIGKWPWHVGLYREKPPKSGNWSVFCGGTLISTTCVLTAAHCLVETNGMLRMDFRILLGKHYSDIDVRDEFVQERRPIEIKVHPFYNGRTLTSDVALIVTNAVEPNDKVQLACLPSEGDLEAGDIGTIVGWGIYSNDSYPQELYEANLRVTSFQDCRKAHPTLEALVREDTFCAGYGNGTSPCNGDSGGGFVYFDATTNKWTIYGIVSAGVLTREGTCDPNYYTVFTRVAKYQRFIEESMDQASRKRRSL